MLTLLLFLVIAVVCLMFDLPIVISIGISTLILILMEPNFPTQIISQTLFSSSDSFPLLSIPFFVLAGEIMSQGGMAKRLVNFVQQLVGNFTGSLGIITILASTIFAAISGSGPATVASIGGMMIPYMIAQGYNPRYAASIAASSGTLGPIIPPSIIFIVYGVIANVSIGDMFIAGVAPGLLIIVALLVMNYLITRSEGMKQERIKKPAKVQMREFWRALNEAKWALLAPVLILGGIYGAIVTPTEASIIAVVYSFIICFFVYREVNWKSMVDILMRTVSTAGSLMMFVGMATIFGKYLSLKQIPQALAEQIANLTTSPILILLVINLLLLLVGMFMETIAAILIFAPLLLPIVSSVGVDPVHFGIILCLNLSIGMITPPFGINLFIGSKLAGVPFEQTFRYLKWALITLVIVLLFVTFIPSISLFLPGVIN